jgi:hypothetical protein
MECRQTFLREINRESEEILEVLQFLNMKNQPVLLEGRAFEPIFELRINMLLDVIKDNVH